MKRRTSVVSGFSRKRGGGHGVDEVFKLAVFLAGVPEKQGHLDMEGHASLSPLLPRAVVRHRRRIMAGSSPTALTVSAPR